MHKKNKSELFEEYNSLYLNEILPRMDEYEKIRKDELPVHVLSNVGLICIIFAFITGIIHTAPIVTIIFVSIGFVSNLILFTWKSNYCDKQVTDKYGVKHLISATKSIHSDIEILLKQNVMQKVLDIFGDFRWEKGIEYCNQYVKDILKSLFIFPKFNDLKFDDCFFGNEDGVNINIYETRTNMFQSLFGFIIFVFVAAILLFLPLLFLTVAIGALLNVYGLIIELLLIIYVLFLLFRKFVDILNDGIFKGVVISYNLPKQFKGRTFVYENKPSNLQIHTKIKTGYERVNLEDIEFNKNYIVYSDNQIEARYLLTTGFIERFNNIKTAFKAIFIRAEFIKGELVLVIGVKKDLFRMGSLFQKSNTSTFMTLFEEIYSVLELGRHLKIAQDTGL